MKRSESARSIGADAHLQLRAADWEDIGIRLAGYAAWKARNHFWRTGRSDTLPGGKTPEDVAAEAILKVFAGERAWDPQRGALFPYLQGVVDSLLSHLTWSFDHRAILHGVDPASGETGAVALPPLYNAVGSQERGGPEERIATLRTALGEEHQGALIAVVDAILRHCEPRPQAIAEYLQTTVADINNRLKRLRRFALRSGRQERARPGVRAR